MGRLKCSKCGKLANVSIKGEIYCLECAPKPTMPVMVEETFVNEVLIEKVERPRPWPDPPKHRLLPENEQPVQKKPWWKRWFSF